MRAEGGAPQGARAVSLCGSAAWTRPATTHLRPAHDSHPYGANR
ncbi:hypothetical protein QFZ32_005043 [Streptomyces canus]|nr:hypothetical protein [Streptomyces canus]MDQ1069603.1 hypothetical protein [Streptomyces canus]